MGINKTKLIYSCAFSFAIVRISYDRMNSPHIYMIIYRKCMYLMI
nr:MAG TPA: hypothetical protein [Caudoviricetes sp.]